VFKQKVCLTSDSLILAGDLNFTTSIEEVWGVDAVIDPLGGYFSDLFTKNQLVDVQPPSGCPPGAMADMGAKAFKNIWIESSSLLLF
jgi:hypothetical protein